MQGVYNIEKLVNLRDLLTLKTRQQLKEFLMQYVEVIV